LLGAEGDDANIPLALLFGDEACKSPNRVFADDVCGGAVIFGAAAALEIDDISGAAFLHKGDDIFRTEKGAAEVGLNYAVPEIFAHKADAGPAWNTPIEMRHDSGVIDQSVDLTEMIDNFMNHASHILLVAHIRGNRECLGVEAVNLTESFVYSLHVGVGENDLGSRFR